jgi:hypothetical protein
MQATHESETKKMKKDFRPDDNEGYISSDSEDAASDQDQKVMHRKVEVVEVLDEDQNRDGDSDETNLDEHDKSLLGTLTKLCENNERKIDPVAHSSGTGTRDTETVEEEPQWRAHVSTLTAIEVFPKGFKGRDSPFHVRKDKEFLYLHHEAEDQSACSAMGNADFGSTLQDTSATASVVQQDVLSVADKDKPLTPLRVNINDKEVKNYKWMTVCLPGEELPVLVRTFNEKKGTLSIDKCQFCYL